MTAYWSLLQRRPAYRALFIADLISNTGDWFSLVAISMLTVSHSGDDSGRALALVLCAHLLPGALLAPVAGFLADRFDRRRLLIGGAILEGIITLAMVAAASVAAVTMVQWLLLLRSAIAALREPAAGAALPNLVSADELPTANALSASAWSTTFVLGMAAGGLATAMGVVPALAIDAASFFVAAAVFVRLPNLEVNRQRQLTPWSELSRALRLAMQRPLRGAVFGKTPMALAGGAAWVALNVSAQEMPLVAGGAAVTIGLLQALRGIGTGVGPLLARSWLTTTNGRAIANAAAAATFMGTLAVSASFAAVPTIGTTAAAGLIVMGVLGWGIGNGALWVITQTEMQRQTTDDVRGKMLAFDGIGFAMAMCSSALIFGIAKDQGAPLFAVIIVVVVAAAALWMWLRVGAAEHASS